MKKDFSDIHGDGTLCGEMSALVALMRHLREPDGCPWDRKQTHSTLRPYLLEETYEVLETLDAKDYDALRVELGDLLLQIVFHAQIASEAGEFELTDSIKAIREKLIVRHPHVFGELKLETAEDVRDNWERIKLTVENGNGEADTSSSQCKNDVKPKGTLDGVPNALPSLTRAYRVQEKMAGVGFDWPSPEGALDKLDEEIAEAREAIMSGDRDAAEEEIGDLLFSVVNSARLAGFSAEEALRKGTTKVINRFSNMEALIREDGLDITTMTLEELDRYWDIVKEMEKSGR